MQLCLKLELHSYNYLRIEATDIPFCPLTDLWLSCIDDGLTLPDNKEDAVAAFILLRFNSSSTRFFPDTELEDSGKMEEALIAARFSLLFRSNFEENLTAAAPATSSSDGGRSRIPRPSFLACSSSSATFLF